MPMHRVRADDRRERGAQRASRVRGGITMPEALPGAPGSIQRRRARLSLHMPGLG